MTAGEKVDSLKFVTNSKPSTNCSGKSWAALNLTFMASRAPSFSIRGRLVFQCPFPNILPTPDRRCSYCCLFQTPISLTTKLICGSTDRCTRVPFMRLDRRKPGRRRSFALRVTSRLPFALGKYSPYSFPTNDVAASGIRKLLRLPMRTGQASPCFLWVTTPFSKRRTMQSFWNGWSSPPLSPGYQFRLIPDANRHRNPCV